MTKKEFEKMVEEDRKILTQRWADKFQSELAAMRKQRMEKIKKISEED